MVQSIQNSTGNNDLKQNSCTFWVTWAVERSKQLFSSLRSVIFRLNLQPDLILDWSAQEDNLESASFVGTWWKSWLKETRFSPVWLFHHPLGCVQRATGPEISSECLKLSQLFELTESVWHLASQALTMFPVAYIKFISYQTHTQLMLTYTCKT